MKPGDGSYKHGLYTQRAKAARRLISDLLRQCRKTIGVAAATRAILDAVLHLP
jgi:hypothetical protein